MLREFHELKALHKIRNESKEGFKSNKNWRMGESEEARLVREADELVKTQQDGLRVLLLYRALLCACICATAADISCVEGTALGQRVIQIL